MSITFDVRVVPRSSREKVELQADHTLKAWVHAPPAEGEANAAVCELLAKKLRVPKSSVTILRGVTSRAKTVVVVGIELSEARKRLSL